jgi:transcriptional regulator with XRE-family HTH domain
MNLGKAIMSVRKQLGIKQYELAEMCTISQTSLSQIETGLKRPSPRTLKKICAAFEVPDSVLYILGMQDTDIPESKKEIYALLFPSIKSLTLQMVTASDSKVVVDIESAND